MADRFPSIEDLDNGDTADFDGLQDGTTNGGTFLDREKAALGADADAFRTPNDVPSVSVQDGFDDDLLGGGDGINGSANDDLSQFQRSFPAVDTRNERMAPGGTITGSTSPFLPGVPTARSTSPFPPSYPSGEEPAVITSWRESRDAAIVRREEASAARKESTIKEAQEAIDEFYVNYNQKREKGVAQTRKEAEEFLAKREDTSAGGTSWERIARLVDVKKGGPAGAGKERFRELLGGLAKDAEAPGAKGY